ncbi:hypothetical protein OsI_25315 [Oryza sativa Indica Group]|uniref:Uncharacterized protein n=2 Tax=Oryza sativa TaxID=4530 RepID=A3BHM4_ORYSJ|nr:hypothetical protein OsI_25315 [Oryza sativa Indica Group]EAZ39063.1 hypothetical protein OsJ_23494 [Oryza sativa Japonica Group]
MTKQVIGLLGDCLTTDHEINNGKDRGQGVVKVIGKYFIRTRYQVTNIYQLKSRPQGVPLRVRKMLKSAQAIDEFNQDGV